MIDKSIILATSSWPFVEARKLVKERQKIFEKKGKITLQTGYGPSGLPHIGTFAEVARTTMMVNAIKQIIDIPLEIITFLICISILTWHLPYFNTEFTIP